MGIDKQKQNISFQRKSSRNSQIACNIRFSRLKPSLVVTCLVIAKSNLGVAFTPKVNSKKRKAPSLARRYRVEDEELLYLNEDVFSSSHQDSLSFSQFVPAWTQQFQIEADDGHNDLFMELESIVHEKYLSHSDFVQISSAIKIAANGERRKIAGAVKLCQILVETMDMGIDTIIAAAFHYCSCYEAEEINSLRSQCSSASIKEAFSSLSGDHEVFDFRLQYYSPDVTQIVRDSASLKRTEKNLSSLLQLQHADADTIRALLLSETKDWRALAIRSAAALTRLRDIIQDHSYYNEYNLFNHDEMRVAREALHIYAPLASRLGMHRLKNELEGAAFRILYRRQYETVTNMMQQTRGWNRFDSICDGMEKVIAEVTKDIIIELQNDPALSEYTNNIIVSARVKQPYSLWKKMLRIGAKNVLEVPDALALRIVIDGKQMSPDEDEKVTQATDRALCYYVRDLCSRKWKPDPENSRFKDYVERPKKNGYQSLHYHANTEFQGDDWSFEIQVRSREMHQVAEYGLAAHWEYKLEHENEHNIYQLDHSSEAYLKSVQEWNWEQAQIEQQTSFEPTTDQCFSDLDYVEEKVRIERDRANAEHLAPYLESFSSEQSSLTRNQVFVFLSPTEDSPSFDSKIISLPSGSCVMDALRKGEKLYGIRTSFSGEGVVQNDKKTELTQRLKNGDVLKVPAMSVDNIVSF